MGEHRAMGAASRGDGERAPDSDAVPFGASWRRWAARRAQGRLVSELEMGARCKVEGAAMAIAGTMRAPVSGRECVFWVVDDIGSGERRVSEASFFISDREGQRVLVEPERCVIDLPRDELLDDKRRYMLEGIIAPGEIAYAWGIVTGTGDVSFVDAYRSATNVERRIRSTSVDRAVIGRAPK